MKIPNIKNLSFNTFLSSSGNAYPAILIPNDSFSYNDDNFDKSVLVRRGIITEDKDLSEFFDEISKEIFKDENSKTLSSHLKQGYVSLSTSCYDDIKEPYSAKGVVLNPAKTPAANCAKLEDEILSNRGVGVNFSEFNYPIEQIRKINSYFKYREKSLRRPPAGIALLNVNHPQILDFITLKDNEDFKNWCFDLSVIVPSDFLAKVNNNEDITLSNGKTIRAKVIYHTLLNSMLKTGEPGVIFSDEKNYICDCCAAVPLKENENLTLAHINLAKFYKNSELDVKSLSNAADILSKAMKNINPNGYIGIVGYQSLLDKMNINYGDPKAIETLENCLKTIKNETVKNNVKMAISPTGGVSRLLRVSPSIEPKDNSKISYYQELDTVAAAQKYMDGNISKTIILKPNSTLDDIDKIVRYSERSGLKGISVYNPKN